MSKLRVTGDPWIPRTKDQWRGKCFLLMSSSWEVHNRFGIQKEIIGAKNIAGVIKDEIYVS